MSAAAVASSSSSSSSSSSGSNNNKVDEAKANNDSYFGNVRLGAQDVLHTDDDVVVSMKNVHKTYLLGVEGIPALRGVSVTIRKGEFVVVFGTSGGGKTTMLNLIGTIDKPTKGEMFLCGHRATDCSSLSLPLSHTALFSLAPQGITDRTSDALLAEIRLKKM
jgi:ABC-type glutathione transport system ATPase component